MSGSLAWKGRVAPLAALFVPPNIKANGALTLDARIAGTLSSPSVDGEALLTEGRIEHLEHGSHLEDLTLRLAFERTTPPPRAGHRRD